MEGTRSVMYELGVAMLGARTRTTRHGQFRTYAVVECSASDWYFEIDSVESQGVVLWMESCKSEVWGMNSARNSPRVSPRTYQKYEIKAVDVTGKQEKSITMKFERNTPIDNTNEKDNAEKEWF